MSMLGNFAGRALAGGVAGGMMSGNWGGAAGGAAVAGFGGGALAKYGRGMGLAGRLQRGAKLGLRGVDAAASRLSPFAGRLSGAGLAANTGMRGLSRAGQGLSYAKNFIGQNASKTNRVGGYGMAAMGAGAGGYIGSMVLSSNR